MKSVVELFRKRNQDSLYHFEKRDNYPSRELIKTISEDPGNSIIDGGIYFGCKWFVTKTGRLTISPWQSSIMGFKGELPSSGIQRQMQFPWNYLGDKIKTICFVKGTFISGETRMILFNLDILTKLEEIDMRGLDCTEWKNQNNFESLFFPSLMHREVTILL